MSCDHEFAASDIGAPVSYHRTSGIGLFVSVDGPGGVGKSTLVAELAAALRREAIPIHVTTEPTRTPLGNLLRHGTDTYHGLALACLVAGDRHHHLDSEICPALARGHTVISDRYLPSSLVLQRMDGLEWDLIRQLNTGLPTPDLAVIVNAQPHVIAARIAARGAHSRFERQTDAGRTESRLYDDTARRLAALGWPICAVDATDQTPEQLTTTVCAHILARISGKAGSPFTPQASHGPWEENR